MNNPVNKTVTFNVSVSIPNSYKWIAQDADGTWYAYTTEPTYLEASRDWNVFNKLDMLLLKFSLPQDKPEETLKRV